MLTEKEDSNLANHQRANSRRDENPPKDMVVITVIFQVAWQFQRNLTSHRLSCPHSPLFWSAPTTLTLAWHVFMKSA